MDREIFKAMSFQQIKQITDHTIDAGVKRFGDTVVEVKILNADGTDLVFVNLPGTYASPSEGHCRSRCECR